MHPQSSCTSTKVFRIFKRSFASSNLMHTHKLTHDTSHCQIALTLQGVLQVLNEAATMVVISLNNQVACNFFPRSYAGSDFNCLIMPTLLICPASGQALYPDPPKAAIRCTSQRSLQLYFTGKRYLSYDMCLADHITGCSAVMYHCVATCMTRPKCLTAQPAYQSRKHHQLQHL